MGGLRQTGSEDWTPWVGGKPLATWSGLVDPEPNHIAANRYRPVSAGSAGKSERYRTEGLEDKLSKGANLLEFQNTLWKKLEK